MRFDRPTRPLRLGAHRFDPALNELSLQGQAQRLPVRLADLLLRLALQPGQVVRRETLLDEVWERRHVNEEVLSRAIADLRQALGDEAKAPRYIETLPKVGYRLVCEVAREASEPAAAAVVGSVPAPARAASPSPARRSAWLAAGAALLLVAGLATWWWTREARRPDAGTAPLSAARLLQARPFTSDPGRELQPRFTPDARWVVYTRYQPGGAAPHVRLRAVDGTDDRALVQDEHDNFCGSVAPDGRRLAWLRTRDGACEVMLRELLGGAARRVASCGTAAMLGCPVWNAEGTHVLMEHGGESSSLVEVALADGATRPLTTPPPGNGDRMPRLDPRDGSVVFWRGDGARQLMRLARDARAPVAIDETGFLAFGHAFAPDGTLFTADDRFGQRALVRRLPAPAELLGGNGARYPDFAPDGALVYEVAHYDANLWRIDLADPAAPPVQLTRALRYDSQPALSPDGRWLAFGSNRDGREGVYLVRADGRDERKLPLDPAHRWTSPAWSRDGAALLVLRYAGDDATACRHELASAQTECPPGLASHRNGTFFLDDASFGAVDETPRHPGLWRHAFDGSQATPIDTHGAVDRCRASDRVLACHRPGLPGLWVQDRATGVAREILPELHRDLRAWDLAAGAIWFPRGGEAAGLYRHDLALGSTERVHDWVPSAIGDALSVAPDGRYAVLARTDALEVDLMYLAPP